MGKVKSAVKCPQCGSTLTGKGSFCNFCGSKLAEDVTKIEINQNVRIEDIAALKKAEYEAQLHELKVEREKRAKRQNNRRNRAVVIYLWLVLAVLIGSIIYGFFDWKMAVLYFVIGFTMLGFIFCIVAIVLSFLD